ncbi:MAG: hypothetical protein O2800_07520 [Planctomycetota bacterium]|nr:hypothetical protein [Planctomycetota bacterium]
MIRGKILAFGDAQTNAFLLSMYWCKKNGGFIVGRNHVEVRRGSKHGINLMDCGCSAVFFSLVLPT